MQLQSMGACHADLMTKYLTGSPYQRHAHVVQNVPNEAVNVVTSSAFADQCPWVATTVTIEADEAENLSETIRSDGIEGNEQGEDWGVVPKAAHELTKEYLRLHEVCEEGEINNVTFVGLLTGVGMSNDFLMRAIE